MVISCRRAPCRKCLVGPPVTSARRRRHQGRNDPSHHAVDSSGAGQTPRVDKRSKFGLAHPQIGRGLGTSHPTRRIVSGRRGHDLASNTGSSLVMISILPALSMETRITSQPALRTALSAQVTSRSRKVDARRPIAYCSFRFCRRPEPKRLLRPQQTPRRSRRVASGRCSGGIFHRSSHPCRRYPLQT